MLANCSAGAGEGDDLGCLVGPMQGSLDQRDGERRLIERKKRSAFDIYMSTVSRKSKWPAVHASSRAAIVIFLGVLVRRKWGSSSVASPAHRPSQYGMEIDPGER